MIVKTRYAAGTDTNYFLLRDLYGNKAKKRTVTTTVSKLPKWLTIAKCLQKHELGLRIVLYINDGMIYNDEKKSGAFHAYDPTRDVPTIYEVSQQTNQLVSCQ